MLSKPPAALSVFASALGPTLICLPPRAQGVLSAAPRAVRKGLLALLLIATTLTGCSAQSGKPQPQPPLTRPASVSEDAWIRDWAGKVVINASLKAGENYIYPRHYPYYLARLSIENKTDYPLRTGKNLYLVQTAKRTGASEPTTDLLQVIDGSFKLPPLEDFSGAVEVRGERLTDSTRMGLIDWVTAENRGGFYSTIAAVLYVGGFRSKYPVAQDFGETGPGGSLLIDTEELQLSVAVRPEKLAEVYVVSPLLQVGAGSSEAQFRYLLRFQAAGTQLAEAVLVPMTLEALTRIVSDNAAPLWKRVFAARWAGLHAGTKAGPMLLSALQDTSPGLRVAALDGLGSSKYTQAFDAVLKIAQDAKGHPTLRRSSIISLGQLGDRRATEFLISTATARETALQNAALEALAALGDPAARETVLKLLESGAVPSADVVLPFVDESVLDRLRSAANNPKANRRAALGAIAKLGTPRSMSTLSELYQKFDKTGRMMVCAALDGVDKPEAVPILQTAVQEKDQSVRYYAMTALASVKSPQRTEILLSFLSIGDSETVTSAIGVLSKAPVVEAEPRLLAILNDRSLKVGVRRKAAEALGSYPGADSVKALIAALIDSEKDVRVEAAQTLSTIPGKEQLPALAKALSDSEMLVRLYAARALADLGGHSSCQVLAEAFLREANGEAADTIADGLIRVGCRDHKQAAPLVGRLDSTDKRYRGAVGRYLSFASGQTYDTGYDASPASVNAAKAAWSAWSNAHQ